VPGVVPAQVQDFSPPFVELHEIPVCALQREMFTFTFLSNGKNDDQKNPNNCKFVVAAKED